MPLHETANMKEARPGVIRSTQEFAEASPATSPISTVSGDDDSPSTSNSRESPRELRNKAEKQRRDKLNQSISELASMVPPVVAASRKIDKTGVLRLTAHFLRSHQYVFGESISPAPMSFSQGCSRAVMSILDGFLLTTTYKGIIVVVSPNVQQYLGYTELDLLGQNVFTIIHKDDQKALREQLMPRSQTMGPNGELIIPDRPDGKAVVAKALADEQRRFVVRFKKHTQRSESAQYLSCHVEGSLRKSDRACRTSSRCCQMLRRARARGDNPCSSGNDVVFVGVVRPKAETFRKEALMEEFRMEYRTRHSIDGQIIQCDQRISLITGYMTDEVHGVNAMNFMHRDDVRWVIIALRQMYDQHRLYGESCYRLMMKNGQFIYMKTRGALVVDQGSAVTSFVCNNTVIDAVEGEQLIKQMKDAYNMLINNNINPLPEPQVTEVRPDDHSLLIEDPKELEQVILHLVTNLPSPLPAFDDPSMPKIREGITYLNIIPPGKEHILSGIEKIYTLVNYMDIPRSKNNSQVNKPEETPQTSQRPAICFEPQPSTSKQGNSTFIPNISSDNNYRISPDVEDFGEIYLNIDPTEQGSSNTTNDNGEGQASTSFADYIDRQPNTQAKYNFSTQDSDCEIIDLDAPSTSSGITGGPSTSSGITGRPSTSSGITGGPSTSSGITGRPSTSSGITGGPSTSSGITGGPSTSSGITGGLSTSSGITGGPSTSSGITGRPSTSSGITGRPSTSSGITGRPSTSSGITGRPSTSSGITGTKRSIDQPDEPEPESNKKKMIEELDLDEDFYDPTSPILEEFIQEAILTTQISQIDDAIVSLEEVFDPFSEIMGNLNGRNVQRGGAYDPNKQNEHREPN